MIFTSVEKKVGQSLYLALKGTIDGTQEYGKACCSASRMAPSASPRTSTTKSSCRPMSAPKSTTIEAKISRGEINVDTVM